MVRWRARPAYKLQRAGGNCKDGTQGTFIYHAGTRLVTDWLLLVKLLQSALPGRLGVKHTQHKMVYKEHVFRNKSSLHTDSNFLLSALPGREDP